MLVFSGQTKTTLTMGYNHTPVRSLGNQEFPIVPSLVNMVKYAEMILDKNKIRYCLEKAWYEAMTGRMGPGVAGYPAGRAGRVRGDG